MKTISAFADLKDHIARETAVLVYCSLPGCGVCASLKPKVIEMAKNNFPGMGLYYVDIEAVPEARGQFSLFAVPVVLVFFQGKETIREVRNFGLDELGAKIDRYYSQLFE
jgi:thioredoxin-like negative regulator of GroEL